MERGSGCSPEKRDLASPARRLTAPNICGYAVAGLVLAVLIENDQHRGRPLAMHMLDLADINIGNEFEADKERRETAPDMYRTHLMEGRLINGHASRRNNP